MKTLIAILLASIGLSTSAQSTAFTYQGALSKAGSPASGYYDLRFTLHDAAAGGNQIGSLICLENVPVTNGVFSVALDFGSQFASSAARFIEVRVREDTGSTCADNSGYTTLTPRQIVTAVPTALRSSSTFSVNASDGSSALTAALDWNGVPFVGIGTTAPKAKLHVASGDLQVGKPNEDWIFHTRSHANGDFLHITDSDNGVFQFQRGLIVHQNGNVGVGTTAPASKLDVAGNLNVAGTITNAAQTRWKSIHGSAFTPQYLAHPSFGTIGGMQVIDSFGTGNSGTVGYANGEDPAYFFAPLDLPHGASLNGLCVVGRDSMPGRDIVLSVEKISLSTGQVTEVLTTFSNGSIGTVGVWCHTVSNEVINNNAFVYALRVTMATGEPGQSGTHWLLAARVQYSVNTPMP